MFSENLAKVLRFATLTYRSNFRCELAVREILVIAPNEVEFCPVLSVRIQGTDPFSPALSFKPREPIAIR